MLGGDVVAQVRSLGPTAAAALLEQKQKHVLQILSRVCKPGRLRHFVRDLILLMIVSLVGVTPVAAEVPCHPQLLRNVQRPDLQRQLERRSYDCELGKEEHKTAKEETQEPLKKTAKVKTFEPLKETAKERTSEPRKKNG